MTTYTLRLVEDPETGDLILPLTPDILSQVGWAEGDVLQWFDNQDGSWSIAKKADNEKN